MSFKTINTLECIEINPEQTARKCVIWLHGLGADGSDFVPVVPELALPAALNTRFVFPNAPIIPITINNGFKMPGWFDIYDMSIASRIDEAGIANSVNQLNALIEREEMNGIAAKDIVLAGFSQGAVIALTTGLQYPKKLAGILALSGYLPLADTVIARSSKENKQVSIFIGHGTQDNIVPYALGKSSYVALKDAGYPVIWRGYDMQHSVCQEEIQDIGNWMAHTFSESR